MGLAREKLLSRLKEGLLYLFPPLSQTVKTRYVDRKYFPSKYC